MASGVTLTGTLVIMDVSFLKMGKVDLMDVNNQSGTRGLLLAKCGFLSAEGDQATLNKPTSRKPVNHHQPAVATAQKAAFRILCPGSYFATAVSTMAAPTIPKIDPQWVNHRFRLLVVTPLDQRCLTSGIRINPTEANPTQPDWGLYKQLDLPFASINHYITVDFFDFMKPNHLSIQQPYPTPAPPLHPAAGSRCDPPAARCRPDSADTAPSHPRSVRGTAHRAPPPCPAP